MKLKPLLLVLLIATSTTAVAEDKIVIPIGNILRGLFGGNSETTQEQNTQNNVQQAAFTNLDDSGRDGKWSYITDEQWIAVAPILQAASECRSKLPNTPEVLALLRTSEGKEVSANFFKKAVVRGSDSSLNFRVKIRPADGFMAFEVPVKEISIERFIAPNSDEGGGFSIYWKTQGRVIEEIAKKEKIKLETTTYQRFYAPKTPSNFTSFVGDRKTKVGKLLIQYEESDFKGNKEKPAFEDVTKIWCLWW
jgi:hypothetical protein